jgi:hypothetical protein
VESSTKSLPLVACLVVLRFARSCSQGWVRRVEPGRVGGGVEFRHTVGVLRDQARRGPSGRRLVIVVVPGFGVGVLWLFDFWIVDASIARTVHPSRWGSLEPCWWWGVVGVGVCFCSVCLCCFC